MAEATTIKEFKKGTTYDLAFNIDGEIYKIRAIYTGKGMKFGETKCGEFVNANNPKKTYLFSIKQLLEMQGEAFNEDVFSG